MDMISKPSISPTSTGVLASNLDVHIHDHDKIYFVRELLAALNSNIRKSAIQCIQHKDHPTTCGDRQTFFHDKQ